MSEHLALHRLEPEAVLTPEEERHLEHCERCRFEARLLRDSDSVAIDMPFEFTPLVEAKPRSAAPLPVTPPTEGLPDIRERYRIEEPLGAGGMGEVFRAWDEVLRRPVALKRVHKDLLEQEGSLERFLGEARVGARLQHPGIVPVHDLGTMGDEQVAFVMKEVEGGTLQAAILDPAWTETRVLSALVRVAEAIAYAHSHEVVHRDLKPLNIMLGAFGEVWVLDWGIARVRGEARQATVSGPASAQLTQAGTVAGTRAYMAPEQAAGETHRIGPASDVFALGIILHETLLGRRPDLIERSRLAERWPGTALRQQVPEQLAALCEDCLQMEPLERPTASQLSRRMTDWLDGSRRREQARDQLAAVDGHRRRAESLRARADERRDSARRFLAELPSWAGAEARRHGRQLEAEALELDAEAEGLEGAVIVAASAALSHDPDLGAAHDILAAHYRIEHEQAEARGAPASGLLGLLRMHDRGQHARYLQGTGTLTLATDHPATLTVLRLEPEGASLVETPLHERATPVTDLSMDRGRYVLHLEAPGRATTRIPAVLPRGGDWQARRPGADSAWTHTLPPVLPDGQVHVAAGWTAIGGDEGCHTSLPAQQVWVDGFVMRSGPVTVGEYLEFLNARASEGRVEEALTWAPRERPVQAGELGLLLVDWSEEAGFTLRPDAEGDLWDLRWPIFMVDWTGACAFADWCSERDGVAWRLPWELEWERAARGADGRAFPWGSVPEPTHAHVAGARPGRSMPGVVDEVGLDTSPFGVHHLAGNVSEWTLDVHDPDGPVVRSDGLFVPPAVDRAARRRTVRGGNWAQPLSWGRAAFRSAWDGSDRRWVIGFRLVRDVPPG